ncbi:MAG: ribulokinase [Spirochaetaceae bacterium]|nr:MAG: ribulokinase [Spirochaetaceae bacterium]
MTRVDQYVIGIDYGTDSVRSVVVNASTGLEVSSSVFYYPRWKKGLFCNPDANQFRQHPLDYIEGLEKSIREALKTAPKDVKKHVRGISVDTTGSTPVAVDREGVPLSLTNQFKEDPDAMFVLWKDHTATGEAACINEVAAGWSKEDYLKYVGGVYSSEWFWAKILHIIKNNPKVRTAAFSWVEHCDWISALLTGQTDPLLLKRSRCAAGHKAMWHSDFNGLPNEAFLVAVDPLLTGIRDRLFKDTYTSDVPMGKISAEWAKKLDLPGSVVIGVGAFDAHMGAVGGQIVPYALSKVMGTSTCDMLVAPMKDVGKKLVKGICGQVDGSIMPGMLGMEAGQSAFGDVYAWFADLLSWSIHQLKAGDKLKEDLQAVIISSLSREAEVIEPSASGILALDWLNGRRTPFANQELKGAIFGLNLASTAPKIFRALVEATAFGAKKIVDCFTAQGVPIQSVIALGGVAKKSTFVMQTVCDVLGLPIRVAKSDQTCALGAAMFASVASGIYPTVEEAQKKMGSGFEREYQPNKARTRIYEGMYEQYSLAGAYVEKETEQLRLASGNRR